MYKNLALLLSLILLSGTGSVGAKPPHQVVSPSSKHIIEQIKELDFKDLDKAQSLIEQLGSTVNERSSADDSALYYVYCGRIHAYLGDVDKAKVCLKQSEVYSKKLSTPEVQMVYLESKAISTARLGEFLNVLPLAKQLVDISLEQNHQLYIGKSYAMMGVTYLETGLIELSEDSFDKAIEIFRELGDIRYEARILLNSATNRLQDPSRYDPQESLNRLLSAQELYKKSPSPRAVGHINRMLGVSYLHLNDYEKSAFYLDKAAETALKQNYKPVLVQIYREQTNLYLITNKLDKALEIASTGLSLSRKIEHSQLERDLNFLLSEIYERKGQKRLAFEHLKEAVNTDKDVSDRRIYELTTSIEHSLRAQREQSKILMLEKKSLAKELQLSKAEKRIQSQVSIFMGIGLFLSTLLAIFYYKSKLTQVKLDLSLRDQLTGAYRRGYLIEQAAAINSRLSRIPESSNNSVAAIMIDCDNFKPINDSLGHSAGDYVLVELVKVINDIIRPSDTLVRWGGDEFVIICEDIPVPALKALCERIRCQIASKDFTFEGNPLSLTCSIGYSILKNRSEFSLDDIISAADRYLYESKKDGKNTSSGNWI
ncbi:tetratricopeptide repeat-containing diguanylate cyclase [Pseudoteredinibacter isoporae]|uniref:diguanylate cyclase n=1 Tax=Pseudoteredinibacter isoporae TaxID=570281 RepID=A0A7X0JSW9_9GAMM|nr:GGDEF domain-containing protein [Pseudoteredinibacter isoporae]MBB6521264.1 diguanylate cyclase (GGDEF)-like protein [Pseudoteredinibacter isoporae]NHO86822.1 diguanylate cyclase [Pseudoteredinibacter isoporae]NIB24726.1 diguanylate cyclase [Pseudoteredinibacter isoporae]